MNKVTSLAGRTYEVGKKVRHYHGWIGEIVKIDCKLGITLYVQPEDPRELAPHMRWNLKDGSLYCSPLVSGLSMGNYTPMD